MVFWRSLSASPFSLSILGEDDINCILRLYNDSRYAKGVNVCIKVLCISYPLVGSLVGEEELLVLAVTTL